MSPTERWYGRTFVQFLINRFASDRGVAFFRDKDGRRVRTRDVHIYSMDDVEFFCSGFFGEKYDMYVTTERYMWSMIEPQPTRLKGHSKWRNEIFKPAQEELEGFVAGKDMAIDIDCVAEHKRIATTDWEKGIAVMRDIVDNLKARGIGEIWVVFSGSGGFHVWAPWEELVPFYEEEYDETEPDLFTCSEFTKAFYTDVALSVGAHIGRDGNLFVDNVSLDMAPNTRRGLVRCPYSLHPKTDNVVFPLNRKMMNDLEPEDIDEKFTVRYVLKHVRLKNRHMPSVV